MTGKQLFMEEYNPNARWVSQKKKVNYTPPEPACAPGTAGGGRGLPPLGRAHGSGIKAFLIIFGVLVLLALAYGLWFFATRPVPAPAVNLDFAAPGEVAAGDPFILSILYANSSTVALRNVSLTVALPDGVFFSGKPQTERIATIPLDDITMGNSGKEDFTLLVATGTESVVQVSSTLSYTTDASRGNPFAASNRESIAVSGTPAIKFSILMPTNVFAGQNFATEISYANTAGHPIDGARIVMQYPAGFTFTEASPTPAFPGNVAWNLGTLAPGAGGTILITGTMSGKDKALYSMSGTAAESVAGTSYTVAAAAAPLSITAAPLTVGATVNNDPNYIAKLNDFLDYKITYTNMSNTTFQNVAVTAMLTGVMFDPSTAQSDAAFDSRSNTFTWYTANTPALASVAPGTSGSLELRIKTKPSFPITSAKDKNFTLGIHLTINSATVPAGTVAASTTASMDIMNKVGGVAAIAAVGYRYEPNTAIKNSGPYPPKVNQETSYTIHWRVTDYATDISNTVVSAYLQSGTTCTGKMISSAPAPVCNPASGEITWTIPSIAAGTGVLGAPLEAIFQVKNIPAVNQVGQTVTLLGKTSLTTADTFTDKPLSASANSVGTDIPEDKAVVASNRNVQP